MMISDFSIKHPIAAIVTNLLLIIFGIIAFERLPLREYPDVDPPVVSIETQYPGASANTVETQITQRIEDTISGIQGINYIESSSKDGVSSINIEFNLNRDIEYAVNDVRDRVARIIKDLPVEADPPEIFKVDSNNNVILWLNLASTRMNSMQLTDYAQRYIVDQLSVLDGVARVRIGGEKRYAMRIWLDRRAMAGKQITVSDIETALRNANIELPGGRVENMLREFTVRIARNYQTPADFAKLVVARGADGHLVQLGEIAKVEIGPENPRTELRGNRVDMIGLGIIKQSTANTLDVSRAVNAEAEKIRAALPQGTELLPSYDTSVFIEAAIHEVFETLVIAMILVIAVIYLFLGSVRAVLIPAVTIPVSLIAAFIVLYAFSFSLNLITLLAFVLAIGLVVDDAIIVLENNYRRLQLGEPPLLAAFRGTRQVGFAVLATTIVLLAVFLPITFLQGTVGRVFTEFAIAISAAIAFSGFVALTLSPVMCAQLLKLNGGTHRVRDVINIVIGKITNAYRRGLESALKHSKLMLILFAGTIAFGAVLFHFIPAEFEPLEDRGAFFLLVQGPEGASFNYMQTQMRQVEDVMMGWVDKGVATRSLAVVPRGFGRNEAVNNAFGIVVLQPWEMRNQSTQQVMYETGLQLSKIPGVRSIPVMRQGISSGGLSQPVQLVIGGTNYDELAQWRNTIMEAAKQNPNLLNVDSDYKETKPQIIVNIDRDRAAELGVSLLEIGRTLETMFGSRNVTTYLDNGEEYDVMLEAQEKQKQTREDLKNIYVRSTRTNQLIPLDNMVSIQEIAAPGSLNRFNRLRSITISANLAPGYTLGQALNFFENVVNEKLPAIAKVDYKGPSRDFKQSGTAIIFTFLLAWLVAYLILSAQFGSFIHPFIVMLTVPLAVTGALLGLYLMHSTLNIYSEIGLIMLIGLAAKNSILIVEFINQLRENGVEVMQAIVDASIIRLRPVLMTAIATLFGAVPLVIATGAGANSRVTLGVVIFSGVLFATFLTLFFIPVFYALIAKYTKPRNVTQLQLESMQQEMPFKT